MFGVMPVTVFAKVTAKEGASDALRDAILSLIRAADEEEGLLTYRAHQDDKDPTVFWFYEVYADDAALAVHGRGERMRAEMGAIGDLLAGSPEMHTVTPVAGKG